MKTQLKKGILEMFVLGFLKKEESYGYKIVQELSEIIEISESTLYPILRRLEAGGSISTYQEEYNGRLRKYYRITDNGKERLVSFKKEWEDIKKVYDFILRNEEGDRNG